jgi:hypothetical protein
MEDPPRPRPRRLTDASGVQLAERVAVLERHDRHLDDMVEEVKGEMGALSTQMQKLSDNVLLLAERVTEAAKSRDKWKNWFLGIAASLAVALIVFLATIAWRVQGARLPSP